MLTWDVQHMQEEWNRDQSNAMKKKKKEQMKEKIEAVNQVSLLDYQIWSLQVNPKDSQNMENSEENVKRFSNNIRGFKYGC